MDSLTNMTFFSLLSRPVLSAMVKTFVIAVTSRTVIKNCSTYFLAFISTKNSFPSGVKAPVTTEFFLEYDFCANSVPFATNSSKFLFFSSEFFVSKIIAALSFVQTILPSKSITNTASGRFDKTSLGFMLLNKFVKFMVAILSIMLYSLYNLYILKIDYIVL